jgi:hypothetical protein
MKAIVVLALTRGAIAGLLVANIEFAIEVSVGFVLAVAFVTVLLG